jgi:hypothetical protein
LSVWDASRLNETDKKRLLEFFVLGVPAYVLAFAPHARAPRRSGFITRFVR